MAFQFLLPILGGLATAGGIYMQNKAAGQQQQAIASAKRNEWERQKALKKRTDAVNDEAIEEMVQAPDKIDENRARLTRMFQQAGQEGFEDYSTASDFGKQDAEKREAAVREGAEERGAQMGNLGSLGETINQMGLEGSKRNTLLHSNLSQRQRSAAILPYELDAAANVGADKAAMGRLFSAVGGTALSAGLSGAFGGVGGAAGGAPTGIAASPGGMLISRIFNGVPGEGKNNGLNY